MCVMLSRCPLSNIGRAMLGFVRPKFVCGAAGRNCYTYYDELLPLNAARVVADYDAKC